MSPMLYRKFVTVKKKLITRNKYQQADKVQRKVPGNLTIGVVFPNVGNNSNQKLRRAGN